MVAKILIFVCAAFGLAAGSCFEIRAPQPCSTPIISAPITSEASCGSPVFSDNVFSTGSSDASQVLSFPVLSSSDNIVSSGLSSSFAVPVATSDSSFSNVFSSGSFSSSGLQATNGPETSALPVIQAPAVSLPAVEGPVVTLSSQPIPAPRVIAQKCICTKTIVRPQVYQRTVTVPKIQRYLKRTVTPVVENVAYKSTPIAQPECSASSAATIVSGSGFSGVSSPVVVSSGSESCGSEVPTFVSAPSPVVVSSGSGSCGSQVPTFVSAPAPVVASGSCQKWC